MPTPLQTIFIAVLRRGSKVTSAIPTPSLSLIDWRTLPSESTIADRPGNSPLISLGGGLYDRPTLFTIATGIPSFLAYHSARCVPGGVERPPPPDMSGDACGIRIRSADFPSISDAM